MRLTCYCPRVRKPSSGVGAQWRGSATYELLHKSEKVALSSGGAVEMQGDLRSCCTRVRNPLSAVGTQWRGSAIYILLCKCETVVVSSGRIGSATYRLLHKGEEAVISSVHTVERSCNVLPVTRG